MENRAGQHKGDAHRNKYIGLKSETDQRTQNAACASVKQDVWDADTVLIGEIEHYENNIMQSSITQNDNISLPILDETDEESALCNENSDMQYFSV